MKRVSRIIREIEVEEGCQLLIGHRALGGSRAVGPAHAPHGMSSGPYAHAAACRRPGAPAPQAHGTAWQRVVTELDALACQRGPNHVEHLLRHWLRTWGRR